MPILFGVDHDIPKKSSCKNCGKTVRLHFLEELTVQGKFLVFMGICRSCAAVKWNFAGEAAHIQVFLEMMETPEFEKLFLREGTEGLKKISLYSTC